MSCPTSQLRRAAGLRPFPTMQYCASAAVATRRCFLPPIQIAQPEFRGGCASESASASAWRSNERHVAGARPAVAASAHRRSVAGGNGRSIATLVQKALHDQNERLLDPNGFGQRVTYNETADHARAISEALQAAASYLRVPLSGSSARGHNRRDDSASGNAHASGPDSGKRVNVGLIVPPSSAAIVAHLLGVWQCGSVGLLLPFPEAEGLAVVADSASAAAASAANAAVLFGRGGQTLHTYTPDALVQGNTAPSTYSKTFNPNSLPHLVTQKHAPTEGNLERYTRLWEYQISESQCRLLVATPEVAPAATEVAAKLSIPVCILRTCPGSPGEGHVQAHSESGHSRKKKWEVKAYVPDVLHDSSRKGRNTTRWKLVEIPDSLCSRDQETAPLSSEATKEHTSERASPAVHFFQGAAAHAPRAVVYSHKAVADQVTRNKELLELTPDDHVVVLQIASSGLERNGSGGPASMRMLCAPKGLVAAALPAVAAGSAVSVFSASDRLAQDSSLPLPLRLQRLQDRLPEHQKLPQQPEERHALLSGGGDSSGHLSSFSRGRHVRSPGLLGERQAAQVKAALAAAREEELEEKALQLWEKLACLHSNGDPDTTSKSCIRRSDSHSRRWVSKMQKASVLVMDAEAAEALMEAITTVRRRAEEKSARAHSSSSSRELNYSGVPARDSARYMAAIQALRMICICTDEADLSASFSGRWSARNKECGIQIKSLLHRWQSLAGSETRVLHLCSLTETGLLTVAQPTHAAGPSDTRSAFADPVNSLRATEEDSQAQSKAGAGREVENYCGFVAPGVNVEIDKETSQLRVRSTHLAMGFHGRPRSTLESFGTDGVFRSSFGASLEEPSTSLTGDDIGRSDQYIELFKCVYSSAVPQLPLIHRLFACFKRSPKMESHIEGYVKKKPIAGRDWNNLHAPRKHWKKMFL